MSIFADHQLLTTSATVAILSIALGGTSQFASPMEPGYYLGYLLIGAGALLLLATLAAWRNRRAISPLRYLLGGLLGIMLIGVLFGYDPTARLRPHGRFVSLVDHQQFRA